MEYTGKRVEAERDRKTDICKREKIRLQAKLHRFYSFENDITRSMETFNNPPIKSKITYLSLRFLTLKTSHTSETTQTTLHN
jgi:hypothetical protein